MLKQCIFTLVETKLNLRPRNLSNQILFKDIENKGGYWEDCFVSKRRTQKRSPCYIAASTGCDVEISTKSTDFVTQQDGWYKRLEYIK